MTAALKDSGIVLFAHGARDPRWAAPFEAIANQVRAGATGVAIELAFLEIMEPDLDTAIARLVAGGCVRIDVVPLFLGTGGHLRKDLPRLAEAARASHPATDIRLHPAIGEDEGIAAAIAVAVLALAAVGE